MIDPIKEKVVTLAEGTRHIPRRRRGKRSHVSTMYRWTTVGCNGVILESIQIGGTRCTSVEALGRFFKALTEKAQGAPANVPIQSSSGFERASTMLERDGL